MPNSLFAKAYLPKKSYRFVVLLPHLYEGTNIQIFSLITIKIIELRPCLVGVKTGRMEKERKIRFKMKFFEGREVILGIDIPFYNMHLTSLEG